MLLPELPLEMNVLIISWLDLPNIFRSSAISKGAYKMLVKDIFPHPYYYFDFSNEDIKYLHLAIMYNKENIIKWLVRHKIWNVEKTLFLGRYSRINNDGIGYYWLRHGFRLDITLALTLYFAPFRIASFLYEKGVRPIQQSEYKGIENWIIEQHGNSNYTSLLNILGLSDSDGMSGMEYRYSCFLSAMLDYKRMKRWQYQELL